METAICPGCKERVYNDPTDGWRNDTSGFTCSNRTIHSDHFFKFDWDSLLDFMD